eukprot:1655852-Pleurochrysis_carterae.AAC.3
MESGDFLDEGVDEAEVVVAARPRALATSSDGETRCVTTRVVRIWKAHIIGIWTICANVPPRVVWIICVVRLASGQRDHPSSIHESTHISMAGSVSGMPKLPGAKSWIVLYSKGLSDPHGFWCHRPRRLLLHPGLHAGEVAKLDAFPHAVLLQHERAKMRLASRAPPRSVAAMSDVMDGADISIASSPCARQRSCCTRSLSGELTSEAVRH